MKSNPIAKKENKYIPIIPKPEELTTPFTSDGNQLPEENKEIEKKHHHEFKFYSSGGSDQMPPLYCECGMMTSVSHWHQSKMKEMLEKVREEVIGEDIKDSIYECYKRSECENDLRDEQRQKLDQLIKEIE